MAASQFGVLLAFFLLGLSISEKCGDSPCVVIEEFFDAVCKRPKKVTKLEDNVCGVWPNPNQVAYGYPQCKVDLSIQDPTMKLKVVFCPTVNCTHNCITGTALALAECHPKFAISPQISSGFFKLSCGDQVAQLFFRNRIVFGILAGLGVAVVVFVLILLVAGIACSCIIRRCFQPIVEDETRAPVKGEETELEEVLLREEEIHLSSRK